MTYSYTVIATCITAWVIVIGSIVYQEISHPKRCTLYERYTRQISDTVDGPFKSRAYVRCIQEGRE